jgi:hypothetical protein
MMKKWNELTYDEKLACVSFYPKERDEDPIKGEPDKMIELSNGEKVSESTVVEALKSLIK